MKIVSWNCQGAFRKKADIILNLEPDILIIQECENLDKLKFNNETKKPNSSYWYGDNPNKGIGIFSYSEYNFKLLPEFNPEFRYVLPFQITGKNKSFILFAIWAMDNKEHYDARYIGQIWLAINHYSKLLDNSVILIGDFNSNKIWDSKSRVGNHTDVVNKLSTNNIFSVYHQLYNSEQGKEIHPTFHLQKNLNKPYHIDYCFASKDMLNNINNFEIGKVDNWIKYSDHTPINIIFDEVINNETVT